MRLFVCAIGAEFYNNKVIECYLPQIPLFATMSQQKMVKTFLFCLYLCFPLVKHTESLSTTTLQFLIDFVTDKELSSISIIKEDELLGRDNSNKRNEVKFMFEVLMVC